MRSRAQRFAGLFPREDHRTIERSLRNVTWTNLRPWNCTRAHGEGTSAGSEREGLPSGSGSTRSLLTAAGRSVWSTAARPHSADDFLGRSAGPKRCRLHVTPRASKPGRCRSTPPARRRSPSGAAFGWAAVALRAAGHARGRPTRRECPFRDSALQPKTHLPACFRFPGAPRAAPEVVQHFQVALDQQFIVDVGVEPGSKRLACRSSNLSES